MRLHELEVLQQIASTGKMEVVLETSNFSKESPLSFERHHHDISRNKQKPSKPDQR